VLYPDWLPSLTRLPAPERVAAFVRWFWIPEWHLPAGRTSRQHLIAFPACNLVVEPERVGLSGPATRRSHRDLTGTGWAVGALLRPAAVPAFTDDPATLRDTDRTVSLPGLHTPVAAAMSGPGDAAARHRQAVEAFADWLLATVPAPDPQALLANALADLVDTDPEVQHVADVATRLHVSPRTVQRLAHHYVGLTPLAMIRRRRLQEAAQRLREDPRTSLAALAVELGYADQAHLATEFRTVLGLAPSSYRTGNQPNQQPNPQPDPRSAPRPGRRTGNQPGNG
jgi:AraC-like DNA-binding protein